MDENLQGVTMRRVWILLLIIILAILTSCSGQNNLHQPEQPEENAEMKTITMKINDEEVRVSWENNESVKALAELASETPLIINTSQYGGFEQVGSIGTTLPSNDVSTKTKPGDIVLYTSDSIVVFYGSNSWSYTRLGHIEDKSEDELRELLSGSNVVITITAV